MLKITEDAICELDRQYPGFRDALAVYESRELPSCPTCGSIETAVVITGFVGMTISLSAATTKIRLVPNGHPADFYCRACDEYFDVH